MNSCFLSSPESFVDLRRHLGRDARLAEARHALEAAGGVERHDAREDGRLDALGADGLDPVLEDGEVVEELRDDHVAARVALLLQVVELDLHVLVGADPLLAVVVDDAHLLRRRERRPRSLTGLMLSGWPSG